MKKILIVEDNAFIRQSIRHILERENFQVNEVDNGRQAIQRFKTWQPDLILLDIMMPEMDGFDVCRHLRQQSTVSIIFLSSKDEDIDRIIGLEIGADDYITKPCNPRELVARVRAVLRRTTENKIPISAANDANTILQYGKLKLDLEQFKTYWGNEEVTLTITEVAILRALVQHPKKVFTRDELINSKYGLPHVISDRTIDSHIRRLRVKFEAVEADIIETVHGVGYKLRLLD